MMYRPIFNSKKRNLFRFSALALALTSTQISFGQFELIATAGTSHFLGDLGGKPTLGSNNVSDLNWQSTRYMAGLGARINMGHRFALRASGYYTRVSANDEFTNNRERHMRNLDFFSNIYGADAVLEFHFRSRNSRFADKHWYIFGGGGYFRFNPKTHYNGQVVALQPLGTEGQFFLPGRSPYKLSSFTIPFGIGYKFKVFSSGYLTLQVDARKTFTDYIDDASTQFVDKTQLLASNGPVAVALSDRSNPDGRIIGFSEPGAIRANPNNNDNFFFLSVSYNLVIGATQKEVSFSKKGGKHLGAGKNKCYSF
ncbi:MAG: hypothetical protein KG003_13055 [Bacteroidetes bacterium]|nr:hypothetical protein [Bacteroidota bacterium]